MKKLLAAITSLFLVVSFATPAQSAGAKYSVYQKTLSAFNSTATTLTAQQKAQVKAAVDANPTAEKFICTGIRYFSQPMSVNIMVRKRAKAACEYAKQLKPELSTWYQNKPTQARSYAGKVLLTVKSRSWKTVDDKLSLDNLDQYDIPAAALEQVQNLVAMNLKSSYQLEVTEKVGPNVSTEQMELARQYLAAAVNGWSSYYAPSAMHLVVYTKYDAAWVDAVCLDLEKRTCNAVQESKTNPMGNLGSGASTVFPHAPDSEPIIYIAFNNYVGDSAIPDVIAHELWHNLQNHYLSKTPMTMWYHEGTPAYLGSATAGNIYGSVGASLRHTGNGEFDPWDEGSDPERWYRVAASITPDQAVELYSRLDQIPWNPECSDNGGPTDCRGQLAHYHLGAMATEVLIAVYGLDVFMDFVTEMPVLGWQESFRHNFLVEPEYFYGKLAPYIRGRVLYSNLK